MNVELMPTHLELSDRGSILIDWNDGRQDEIGVRTLRQACPCARCRQREDSPPATATGLPIIRSEQAQPMRIVRMHPVGNYAYHVEFSDGHNTGIFSFELLRHLAARTSDSAKP